MGDYITQFADAETEKLSRKIGRIYHQAAQEIAAKLKAFEQQHARINEQMLASVASGEISEQDYKNWLRNQVYTGKQWENKLKSVTNVYVNADKAARAIIDDVRGNVFTESANYAAYDITMQTNRAASFDLYDESTVKRLIQENPQLLPKYKIDEPKDYIWNSQRVRKSVTQGIIQGESIHDIGRRLTNELSASNASKMDMFARTAVTGAQNAGRMERLHEAEDMGINVKKKWLATLDDRTRDTHAALDGQERDIDEPFEIDGMKIDYPGDPTAPPELVYNCRCTLVYVYPQFKSLQNAGQRYDQESGELVANISYEQWKNAHITEENQVAAGDYPGFFHAYSDNMQELYNVERKIYLNDADHVFSGIWANDVTYSDYYDKLNAIDKKRDYYEQKIQQYENDTSSFAQAKVDEFKKKLEELETFSAHGAENFQLLSDREYYRNIITQMEKEFPAPENNITLSSSFGAEAYTSERKNNALWAASEVEADNALRNRTGEVWKAANQEEREAIYEYTLSYHKFNEPLRGIQYGTSQYLGVGNTDLNARYANNGERLNAMTDIIDSCTYDKDVWLQRGVGYGGMDKFFNCSQDLLQNGSEADLRNQLLGEEVTEFGFMSCGTKKGTGFSSNPIILNIYAPSGTKMMYVEPFSAYGGSGEGLGWDGVSKQRAGQFGSEFETILQQGTKFMITKVERNGGGTIYMDLDVIDQSTQQRWSK